METEHQPEAVVFAETCRSSRLLFLCPEARAPPPELEFANQQISDSEEKNNDI